MPARAPSHSPWRHSSPPSAPANRPSSLSISATRTAKARDTLSMARSSLLSRIVALDFNPTPGYWQSPDGTNLIHQTSDYASQGAVTFSVEALFSALRSGECDGALAGIVGC